MLAEDTMRQWLIETYARLSWPLGPLFKVGRRFVSPALGRALPAVRLVGRTAAGETARVLVIDRRFATARLCSALFAGDAELAWSGCVPRGGLRGFIERERGDVDLVLANVPRGLPTTLRPKTGLLLPARVDLVLPVMADREAQYSLAHVKRRNRLRRCEKAGYSWRVGTSPDEIRRFLNSYYRPHVTDQFGNDAVPLDTHFLEQRARHGGVLWLLHEGREVGGDLFRQDGNQLTLLVTGIAAEPPRTAPTPQEALFLLSSDLAREKGCRTVSFGGAAPMLRDGVLLFKLSLGATIDNYVNSHRDLVVDWARPSPVLHVLLQAHPLIIEHDQGFVALTSTVGVDQTAHLAETSKFMPPGFGPLLALRPEADTIEAAMALVATPENDEPLPRDPTG